MKPPCRECQFREVGCHSKCESYIQWRVQLDKYNEQKNMQGDAYKYIGNVKKNKDLNFEEKTIRKGKKNEDTKHWVWG